MRASSAFDGHEGRTTGTAGTPRGPAPEGRPPRHPRSRPSEHDVESPQPSSPGVPAKTDIDSYRNERFPTEELARIKKRKMHVDCEDGEVDAEELLGVDILADDTAFESDDSSPLFFPQVDRIDARVNTRIKKRKMNVADGAERPVDGEKPSAANAPFDEIAPRKRHSPIDLETRGPTLYLNDRRGGTEGRTPNGSKPPTAPLQLFCLEVAWDQAKSTLLCLDLVREQATAIASGVSFSGLDDLDR